MSRSRTRALTHLLTYSPALNLNPFDFLKRRGELVPDLHHHAEGDVGLLHGGEHLGRIDVAAGEQVFDGMVGVLLHRVHLLDRIEQHVFERSFAGSASARSRFSAAGEATCCAIEAVLRFVIAFMAVGHSVRAMVGPSAGWDLSFSLVMHPGLARQSRPTSVPYGYPMIFRAWLNMLLVASMTPIFAS